MASAAQQAVNVVVWGLAAAALFFGGRAARRRRKGKALDGRRPRVSG